MHGPLEVLVALLAAGAAHHLVKRQVVLEDEDDGVLGKQFPSGGVEDRDVGVLDPASGLCYARMARSAGPTSSQADSGSRSSYYSTGPCRWGS